MRVQKKQFFFGLGLTRAGNGFPEVSLLLPDSVQETTINTEFGTEKIKLEAFDTLIKKI